MSTRAQPLVYAGQPISLKGEMLSLTDMWKAAGSPDGRAPNDWRALSSGIDFANHVAEFLNAGKSGNELFTVSRGGRNPGTFAHWQIGVAYAKYLSHNFHMWCNAVVRAHMEGAQAVAMPADLEQLIRRDDGIVRMLAHKVTEIEKLLPVVVGGIDRLAHSVSDLIATSDPRVAVLDYVSVRGLLDDAGAVRKGRNRLNRKVGHELRDRILVSDQTVNARRCPHSGVWLFPRAFADAYMAERGASLVQAHNDSQRGQLHLFRGRRSLIAET